MAKEITEPYSCKDCEFFRIDKKDKFYWCKLLGISLNTYKERTETCEGFKGKEKEG